MTSTVEHGTIQGFAGKWPQKISGLVATMGPIIVDAVPAEFPKLFDGVVDLSLVNLLPHIKDDVPEVTGALRLLSPDTSFHLGPNKLNRREIR